MKLFFKKSLLNLGYNYDMPGIALGALRVLPLIYPVLCLADFINLIIPLRIWASEK